MLRIIHSFNSAPTPALRVAIKFLRSRSPGSISVWRCCHSEALPVRSEKRRGGETIGKGQRQWSSSQHCSFPDDYPPRALRRTLAVLNLSFAALVFASTARSRRMNNNPYTHTRITRTSVFCDLCFAREPQAGPASSAIVTAYSRVRLE